MADRYFDPCGETIIHIKGSADDMCCSRVCVLMAFSMLQQNHGGEKGRGLYAKGETAHSVVGDKFVVCPHQEAMEVAIDRIQLHFSKHFTDVRVNAMR